MGLGLKLFHLRDFERFLGSILGLAGVRVEFFGFEQTLIFGVFGFYLGKMWAILTDFLMRFRSYGQFRISKFSAVQLFRGTAGIPLPHIRFFCSTQLVNLRPRRNAPTRRLATSHLLQGWLFSGAWG